MISVKVTYTVKSSFAAENQENIRAFMKDLRALNSKDIRYTVYLDNDGKTFTHLSIHKDEVIQAKLLNMPSFKAFQEKRDASGLEVEPQIVVTQLVAASYELPGETAA